MNYLWVVSGITIIISILYLRSMYHIGTKKAFRKCLSILIPLALSGIATRIGHLILHDFILLSYYIAGLGTLIFYIILTPIFQKDESDRYSKITKNSRLFAVIVGIITIWLFLSLSVFFINLAEQNILPKQFLNIILLPIRILWLFPII